MDEIIALRGKLTHVARKVSGPQPTKHPVSRANLESYMRFIREIAVATDASA